MSEEGRKATPEDLIKHLEMQIEFVDGENVKLFWRIIKQERRAEKILFAAKAAALRLRAGEAQAAERIITDAINEDGRLAREAIAGEEKPQ